MARTYTGSYNVSPPAEGGSRENLVRIRDRRVAASYMVEAIRLFDPYVVPIKIRDRRLFA
jgi:phosphatidylserine/phosphatidylglycerophosphate/cardiolipin synthase-like enzyme